MNFRFSIAERGMRMRLTGYALAFAVVLGLFQCPAAAKNPSYSHGEVIYHQDFAEVSDFSLTDIQKGTASSENSAFYCAEDVLRIETYDDGRVYAILPPSDWTDAFTIEFEFSFRNTSNSNGYLDVMLTSTGEEPGNISKLTFRAKGTIDDFENPSEPLAERIRTGKRISVKIPVENGVVKSLSLSSNGMTEELDRTGLLLIGSGNRGFSVRNAHVDTSEIYIVNGTDYPEKLGYWAEHSYASDSSAEITPPVDNTETAPETGDSAALFTALAAAAIIAIAEYMKKRKYS